MHDARALIDMGDEAVRRLARRGYTLELSSLESLQSRRSQSIRTANELRAESKRVAQEVQKTARAGGDVSALKDTARKLKEQFRDEPFHLVSVFLSVGEGTLAEHLNEVVRGYPELMLGSYPELANPEYKVKVTLESKDRTYMERALGDFLARLPASVVVRIQQ